MSKQAQTFLSGPTLTFFMQHSRHSLTCFLPFTAHLYTPFQASIYITHIWTALTLSAFPAYFVFRLVVFFPNNSNKFLRIFFTFYLSCFPPFPSLCLLFLFCSHSHSASFSQKPTSSVLSKGMGWEGCNVDRAEISNCPCLRPLSMWLTMTFQGCYFAFVNYLFCKDLFCIKQDVSNQLWHQSHFPGCCISR